MEYTKTKKRAVFFALLAILTVLGLAFWLYNLSGFSGLLTWNKTYLTIFLVIIGVAALPLIYLLIALFGHSGTFNRISTVLSIVLICLCIVIIGAVTYVNHQGSYASNVNLLKATDKIPSKDNVVHMAFGSDPHWDASTANAQSRSHILDQIESLDYDSLFILGDIVDLGTLGAKSYLEVSKELELRLQDTPVRLLAGNHDALIGALPMFKNFFMEKEDFNYRMDVDNLHFLIINVLWDEKDFTSDIKSWLIAQLESIPKEDAVVVLSHSYILGCGYWDEAAGRYWGDQKGLIDELCPIFEKYDVDLHIAGHNHFMEHCQKDGVDYLTVGAMGGKLDENLVYESPYSLWKDNESFGWLDFVFEDNTISFEFVDEDGKSLYSYAVKTN